jgi:predicted component of type VI protein secretion system
MSLILTVIASADGSQGDRSRVVFGTEGGCIGRARDNDWVLADPKRYLSAHHARVRCHQGDYFIEDISTNGVFLNGATQALGKAASPPLHDGDHIRMGNYQIQVGISDDSTTGTRGSTVDELMIDHSTGVSWPAVSATATAAPAAAVSDRRNVPRPVTSGSADIEAFCRGAGIDAGSIKLESPSTALYLAGLLLREALVGAKDLAETQRAIRTANALPAPVPDSKHAALQKLSVEDLLRRLLTEDRQEALDAVQWLRELFGLARRHDVAVMGAMRAALLEYLQRLEPQTLAASGAPVERFRSLTDMPAGRLPVLFTEALVRAFAAELRPGS